MEPCPCDESREFGNCCGPLLKRERGARSAEELMRSRYSAYARAEIAYILETIHPDQRDAHDEGSIRRWAEESEWLGLDLLSAEEQGDDAQVEFVAHYRNQDGERVAHREQSHFARLDQVWYFKDGAAIGAEPVVHDTPKTGRNDPCPCGSGRKFKKCCGANE